VRTGRIGRVSISPSTRGAERSPPYRPSGCGSIRRTLLAVGCLLALAVSGCTQRGAERATEAEAELQRGGAYVDWILARQAVKPERLSAQEVVVLGYVERLRLGLGSPFRLADQALNDPRLDDTVRHRAAAALLHQAGEGWSYRLDHRALALIGGDSAGRAEGTAARHLELISDGVSAAAHPRVGELAVRAGYTLAAAEGLVAAHAPTLAAHAAALIRDRELARRDVQRLLAEADATDRHPLVLLREWRAGLRFEVEAPTAIEPPASFEVHAAPAALRLHAAIRDAVAGGWSSFGADEASLLHGVTRERLVALGREQYLPPSPAVRITLERYAADLARDRPAIADGREILRRFIADVDTEERFAADLAGLARAAAPRLVGLVAMETALALRPLAQERVWWPGWPSPSAADLRRRYGLAAVTFDADIPVHWEGFYRRMIGDALADLEVVLPSLDVRGLSFRIGASARTGSALAIHDPRTRTIRLPPETGPGTIAHEIAHDLDWQVARTRYGVVGGYGTDLALQRGGGDALAAAVRNLLPSETGGLSRGRDPGREAWENRPAESFARMFDGWVAAALAARGRSNGALSSLQDEVLTAYGMAVVPDVRGWDADALLPLLLVTSALSPEQEAEFRAAWSPGRTPGPYRMIVGIAAAPASSREARPPGPLVDLGRFPSAGRAEVAEVERRRDGALEARRRLVCRNPFLHPLAEGEATVRALLHAAADARIALILRRHARAQGVTLAPDALRLAWLGPAGEDGPPLPSPLRPADGCTLTAPR
jgi:hypothetical protein